VKEEKETKNVILSFTRILSPPKKLRVKAIFKLNTHTQWNFPQKEK